MFKFYEEGSVVSLIVMTFVTSSNPALPDQFGPHGGIIITYLLTCPPMHKMPTIQQINISLSIQPLHNCV